jgi:hypothetical protein
MRGQKTPSPDRDAIQAGVALKENGDWRLPPGVLEAGYDIRTLQGVPLSKPLATFLEHRERSITLGGPGLPAREQQSGAAYESEPEQ